MTGETCTGWVFSCIAFYKVKQAYFTSSTKTSQAQIGDLPFLPRLDLSVRTFLSTWWVAPKIRGLVIRFDKNGQNVTWGSAAVESKG